MNIVHILIHFFSQPIEYEKYRHCQRQYRLWSYHVKEIPDNIYQLMSLLNHSFIYNILYCTIASSRALLSASRILPSDKREVIVITPSDNF